MSASAADAGKNKNTAFKKVWHIISTAFVAVVCVSAIFLAGVRLLGYTPYSVLSPSMSPAYSVGSLVYIKAVDNSEIKVGDTITFVAGSDNTVVTHRVVRIDEQGGCVYTKGDANACEDAAPVLYENVLGVVAFSVPYIGTLSNYMSTTSGKFACAAGVLFLIVLLILPDIIRAFRKAPESDSTEQKQGE